MSKIRFFLHKSWIFIAVAAAVAISTTVLYLCILATQQVETGKLLRVETPVDHPETTRDEPAPAEPGPEAAAGPEEKAPLLIARDGTPYELPEFRVVYDDGEKTPVPESTGAYRAAGCAVGYAELLFLRDLEGATARVQELDREHEVYSVAIEAEEPDEMNLQVEDGKVTFAVCLPVMDAASGTAVLSDAEFEKAAGQCVVQIKQLLDQFLAQGTSVRKVVNQDRWNRESGANSASCQFDVYLNDGNLLFFQFRIGKGTPELYYFQDTGNEKAVYEETNIWQEIPGEG